VKPKRGVVRRLEFQLRKCGRWVPRNEIPSGNFGDGTAPTRPKRRRRKINESIYEEKAKYAPRFC
jgi:hypothetical protein